MLRKPLAAVVLLAALALGTASATSLGTFDDVSFAASDVNLLTCEIAGADLMELLPDVPEVGETMTYAGTTFELETLDLSVVSGLPVDCLTETVLQVVLLDGDGKALDVLQLDPDVDDLTAVSPNVVLDVIEVAEIRAVLRDV